VLAAGFGLFVAGTMTGCWSTPTNPPRNPNQNIPKQNVGTGTQGNSPYASSGQSNGPANSGSAIGAAGNNGGFISRQSGAPSDPAARVGMTSGAMAGTTGAGAVPPLNPSPAGNGVQPIATNGGQGATGAVQPVVNIGRGNAAAPAAELDPPPSAQKQPSEKEFPAVPALSHAGVDKPLNWERKTPAFPDPSSAAAPSGPPMPKVKSVDPIEPLGPPPQQ
jgi:hypothetical protein